MSKPNNDKKKRTIIIVLLIIIAILISIIAVILFLCPKGGGATLTGEGFEVRITQTITPVDKDGNMLDALSASSYLGVIYNQSFNTGDANITDVSLESGAVFTTDAQYILEGDRAILLNSQSETDLSTGFMIMRSMNPIVTLSTDDTADFVFSYRVENYAVNDTNDPYVLVFFYAYSINSTNEINGVSMIAVELLGNTSKSTVSFLTEGEGGLTVNATDQFFGTIWNTVTIQDLRSKFHQSLENHTTNSTAFGVTDKIDFIAIGFTIGNNLTTAGVGPIVACDECYLLSRAVNYTVSGNYWQLLTYPFTPIVTGYKLHADFTVTIANNTFNLTSGIVQDQMIIINRLYLDIYSLYPSRTLVINDAITYQIVVNLQGMTVEGGYSIQGADASRIVFSIDSPTIPLHDGTNLGGYLEYGFLRYYEFDGITITGDTVQAFKDYRSAPPLTMIIKRTDYVVITSLQIVITVGIPACLGIAAIVVAKHKKNGKKLDENGCVEGKEIFDGDRCIPI